jgi:hypothetical protein
MNCEALPGLFPGEPLGKIHSRRMRMRHDRMWALVLHAADRTDIAALFWRHVECRHADRVRCTSSRVKLVFLPGRFIGAGIVWQKLKALSQLNQLRRHLPLPGEPGSRSLKCPNRMRWKRQHRRKFKQKQSWRSLPIRPKAGASGRCVDRGDHRCSLKISQKSCPSKQ